MSRVPIDRAALNEYMAVWFCAAVPDTVKLHAMVVHCCTLVQEAIYSLHRVIDHLEEVKDCLTVGWLERLEENHDEEPKCLEMVNALVDKLDTLVHKKEKDVMYDYILSEGKYRIHTGEVVVFGVVGVAVSASITSGSLLVVVDNDRLGGFAIWVDGDGSGFNTLNGGSHRTSVGGAGNDSIAFWKTVSRTKSCLLEVLRLSKWNWKVWVVPSSCFRD
uniref:Uncharacterized protein n=1 Tax=Tanacetum cinerariifolium TaxID=118510 RepID=A0A6L2J677_TANCI|nr:hypothetical protein [Tanacetum cinerariifolium]